MIRRPFSSPTIFSEAIFISMNTQTKPEEWKQLGALEDLMMLQAEPNNPVIITALLSVAINPTKEWLIENFIPRILRHPRFRSRIQQLPSHRFRFQLIPDFTATSPQIDKHIQIQPLVQTVPSFTDKLNDIISTSLPLDGPLWQLHVFPKFSIAQSASSDNNATLVFRIHHSVSDGMGLLKYLATDVMDDINSQSLSDLLVLPRRELANASLKTDTSKSSSPSPTLQTPAGSFVRNVKARLRNVFHVTIGPLIPEKPNLFNTTPIQRGKLCGIIPPTELSVNVIKEASKRLQVTINDLIFTAVSSATALYFEQFGNSSSLNMPILRCSIPVNLHALDTSRPTDVSNNLILLSAPLHADEANLTLRLRKCAGAMRIMKTNLKLGIPALAIRSLAKLPASLREKIWRHCTRSVSLMVTNVPGPREHISIAGVQVDGIQFLAPTDGLVGVSVSIFSYNGGICVGVQGDCVRLAEPQRYADFIKQEVDALVHLSEKMD